MNNMFIIIDQKIPYVCLQEKSDERDLLTS